MLCITNNSIKHQSFVCTQLNGLIVLLLTIQFSILFVCTQFKCQIGLFGPWLGHFQVLPFRARVDQGAMAMKRHSAFPNAPALLELHHQVVLCHIQHTCWGCSYPSTEMLLMYSSATADWTDRLMGPMRVVYIYIYISSSKIYIYIYIYLTDKRKRSFFQVTFASILLYGCTTWSLTKWLEKKLDGNYARTQRVRLNKSWRQHPSKHQLYGHLPPITKTIQVRLARHAGHCW